MAPTTLKPRVDTYLASDEAKWQYFGYPGHKPPPMGTKIHMLTKGKISVDGVWKMDGSVIAWAPLIKRDKEIEAFLGV